MITTTPHRLNGIDPRETVPASREIGINNRSPFSAPSAETRKPRVLAHPLAQHALAMLRDRRTSNKDVRQYTNQLLVLLTLEATSNLALREVEIESKSGEAVGKMVRKPLVFLTVARHGLGVAHDLAELIPGLSVGNITLDRQEGSEELTPRLHLTNAPALHTARVIVFDPVAGSGLAAGIALHSLKMGGVSDLALVCFVLSEPSLARIFGAAPDCAVITAAIDEFDAKRGPKPGVGDLAERLYGET